MDASVKEAIVFVYSYAPSISDWYVLKKELLKILTPNKRKFFSTRDVKTKKQNINAFEKAVIDCWKEITGTRLYLDKQ